MHMGGPLWAKRDLGAWSIPKGEYGDDEAPLDAAKREFHEETGFAFDGEPKPLGVIRQPGGKYVTAWAVEGDADAAAAKSNSYRVEWPRGSGRWRTYPEVDRAEWFEIEEARRRILKGQLPLIERLEAIAAERGG